MRVKTINDLIRKYKKSVLNNGCSHLFIKIDDSHRQCESCQIIKKTLNIAL